jgi:replicative DNA helicase
MPSFDAIKSFYKSHLPQAVEQGSWLKAPCPFCDRRKKSKPGQIAIHIHPESYFRGYFRCTGNCVPGGFHLYFARLLGIQPDKVPGHDPDAEPYAAGVQYPPRHLGAEIEQFTSLLGPDQQKFFTDFGVSVQVLKELRVGFNGRYLVYPYLQESGFAYAARCVLPAKEEDTFWHGNENFAKQEFRIYNVQEIERCAGGALFITEGELNLLILKSLGYPAIAVPSSADLAAIAPQRLALVHSLFLLVANTPDARQSARALATQLGFKARILTWPAQVKRGHHLSQLAMEPGTELKGCVASMIQNAHSFSPFASPAKEGKNLLNFLEKEKDKALLGIETGFAKLDAALDGLRGINIMGGPPKAGKSCFFMQISTDIARRRVPVIYYDFENGRQKIYLRTIVRTCNLPEKKIRSSRLSPEETKVFGAAWEEFNEMLTYFRVVTERQLTPEIMRRHIDFIKHESRKDDLLIVLDSLHKLPFKSLTERRTGIDFWLRQIEAIRDEHQACFLVISELSRGKDGGYAEKPDMSSFKESGDIEYSADNAMILMPQWDPLNPNAAEQRNSVLWLVASRENSPGRVAEYRLDFPYWRFIETQLTR